MRLSLFVAAAAVLSASLAARADTIPTFQLSANLSNGVSSTVIGSLSGTISIDTSLGTVTSDDLTLVVFGGTYTFTKRATLEDSAPELDITLFGASISDALYLAIPETSLANYTGSELCSVDAASDCPFAGYPGVTVGSSIAVGTKDALVLSGSLEPEVAAPTPEPSSFVLVGTGLLGVAGVMRKRFA